MRHIPIGSLAMAFLAMPLQAAPPIYPETAKGFDSLKFETVTQKELPEGVFFWTSQCAESNEDLAFSGRVAREDLNSDGALELIVESECKLQNQYDFWQKRNGRWLCLLTVWGAPELLRKANGYYQITVWWEMRNSDISIRELYSFKGDRYHATRIDEYRGDTFLRGRDTKDREEVLESSFRGQLEAK